MVKLKSLEQIKSEYKYTNDGVYCYIEIDESWCYCFSVGMIPMLGKEYEDNIIEGLENGSFSTIVELESGNYLLLRNEVIDEGVSDINIEFIEEYEFLV